VKKGIGKKKERIEENMTNVKKSKKETLPSDPVCRQI
jgi:hypothetical protein